MRECTTRSIAARAVGVGLVLAAAVPVAAQEAPGPRAVLEEITVTAEKRVGTEQKTAISMTVLTPATLTRNGVGSLADLAAIAPSVNFMVSSGASVVGIRGVSSRDTTEIGDPAISLSIDGFYLQRAIGLNAAVYDVERVEVLRGPQGTLLGRNATGGAINIITAAPANQFKAAVSLDIGSYGSIISNAMLNVPVNDKIQIRVSGQTRDHDGYRDNAPSSDGDDEHSKAARIQIAFQPTDRLKLSLANDYVYISQNGPSVLGIPFVTVGGVISHSMPTIPDPEKFPTGPGSYLLSTQNITRWKAEYDLGFATATYLGGFRKLHYTNLYYLGGPFGTIRQNLSFLRHEEPESQNHEFRLTSNGDDRLAWQVGAYYFSEQNNDQARFGDFPLGGAPGGLFVPLQIYNYADVYAQSYAAFGQASYKITDSVKIEAGARISKDDKHENGSNNIANFNNYLASTNKAAGPGPYVFTPVNMKQASTKATYHLALNWQATADNLLYVKFDTGYKAGGFNTLAAYAPETIKAVEFGSKNRFLGDRAQLNFSAFYYDYTNQQVTQQITLAGGGNTSLTTNAGASEIYGAELEGRALLTPYDKIDAYVAYLHARFTDFATASGGVNVQLAGNRPAQAPTVSLNAGYEHDFLVPGGTVTARMQTHFESASFFSFFNRPDDRQGAYTRSDAMLSYKPDDGNWQVQGYVRNLENSTIFVFGDQTSTTFGGYRYQFAPPRTYGVRFSMDW